jgi:hypothetical protein
MTTHTSCDGGGRMPSPVASGGTDAGSGVAGEGVPDPATRCVTCGWYYADTDPTECNGVPRHYVGEWCEHDVPRPGCPMRHEDES